MAMWAPVSPPVVVVVVSSMLGCSCDSVTTMTLAIVITVMAPGTHHQLPRDEVSASAATGAVSGGASAVTAPGPPNSGTCDRRRASAAQGVPRTTVVRPHPAYVIGPLSA